MTPGCCFQGMKKLKTINSTIDGVYDLSAFNITIVDYKSFEYCYELKEIILPAILATMCSSTAGLLFDYIRRRKKE